MSRENWCESPDPKLATYLQVIDKFAASLKQRIKRKPPRTWAQFWRIWSDEQIIQRQMLMKLVPKPFNTHDRSGDWATAEMKARQSAFLAECRRAREMDERRERRIDAEMPA